MAMGKGAASHCFELNIGHDANPNSMCGSDRGKNRKVPSPAMRDDIRRRCVTAASGAESSADSRRPRYRRTGDTVDDGAHERVGNIAVAVSWWWCVVRPSETKKKCSKPLSKFQFVVACGHFSSLSRLWSTGQESYTVCGVKGTPQTSTHLIETPRNSPSESSYLCHFSLGVGFFTFFSGFRRVQYCPPLRVSCGP